MNSTLKAQRDEFYEWFVNTKHSEEEIFELWRTHAAELNVSFPEGKHTGAKYAMFLRSEKTASAVPSKSVPGFCIHDFGDGSTITVMKRLQEEQGLTKGQAMERIFEWFGLGKNPNGNQTTFNPNMLNKRVAQLRPIQNEKGAYSEQTIATFQKNRFGKNESEFLEILKGFLRACNDDEVFNALKYLKIGFCPISKYDPQIARIILFEENKDGVAYGHYKYNKAAEKLGLMKGLLRKDAKRVLLGSHLLLRFPKDVIVAEGHTDFANNIAKGFACISTGSSTKRLDPKDLNLLSGKHLHDFPDLDIPGITGAMNRQIDIDLWNRSNPDKEPILYTPYLWSDWIISERLHSHIMSNNVSKAELIYPFLSRVVINNGKAGIDLNLMQDIQQAFIQKQYISRGQQISQDLYPKLFVGNWKLLNKATLGNTKKEGYDFVDFHIENNKSPNYSNFFAKFKF